MAKLKAPLLSLGASQQLGKALVFFAWKGLNVVREYVVPSNPKTTAQVTQRGYITAAVADIHAAMADATKPLVEVDKIAYALWASIYADPRTWFNQAVKNWVDQKVATLLGTTFRGGKTTPGASQIAIEIYSDELDAVKITAGNFHYGTSKTAMVNSIAATITGLSLKANATITGLTTGVKYYIQFRPTATASYVGCRSGIYTDKAA